MKHLLNGVAIAAALAIAAPAWAQAPAAAPMSPSGAASAKAPAAHKQTHRRPMRHRMARHAGKMHKMSGDDQMTEQLNREELSRLQGGAAPGAAPMPGGAGQGGPRPSGR